MHVLMMTAAYTRSEWVQTSGYTQGAYRTGLATDQLDAGLNSIFRKMQSG